MTGSVGGQRKHKRWRRLWLLETIVHSFNLSVQRFKKPVVSETITEKDGSVIHSQQRRLERWAEHFGEQFNQPPATEALQKQSELKWIVNLNYPTEEELQREIANLKQDKAAGPDGIPPPFQGRRRIANIKCHTSTNRLE